MYLDSSCKGLRDQLRVRGRAQTAVVSPASLGSAYAPGHEGKSRARGANRWQRPAVAIIDIGFPSRRSEPGRPHVVVLVAASW
jgi:hypothetical protein